MGPEGESVLSACAAELAPEIDRLFVAGHGAARPIAIPVLQGLGVSHAGILIDLRRQLLSPGGCTLEQATAKQRYADPASVEAALREQVRRGLLQEQHEAFRATREGETVLVGLTDALARGIHALWSGHEPVVGDAGDIAASVVEGVTEALQTERFVAFEAERYGFLPDKPSPGEVLWSHLSALRYLRADAHALAWREAGLNRAEIRVLTAVWRSSEEPGRRPGDEADAENQAKETLQRRGWLRLRRNGVGAFESWELTPEGHAARDAIEAATNRYNAPPLAAISAAQRELFLRLLLQLPADPGDGRD